MLKKEPKKRIEKVVICGDFVEYVRYVNPINLEKNNTKKLKDKNSAKRDDNLFRARQSIRHLIWCNQTQYTKFVTLTYEKTELDYDNVIYDFKQFIKKLRRRGYNCPYLWITEHQKSRGLKENNEGSLHLHCLIFTDEFIPFSAINECWGFGSTDIHSVRSINNLGAYVCKYLTKEEFTLYHKHSYHCSRGLKKPVTIANDGYIGDYAIFEYSELFKNFDFYYSNIANYEYCGADGIFENTIIYKQGRLIE